MPNEEKKVEEKVDEPKTEEVIQPKMRQIVIETDGNAIRLVSADTAGRIELIAIFQNLINYLNNQK